MWGESSQLWLHYCQLPLLKTVTVLHYNHSRSRCSSNRGSRTDWVAGMCHLVAVLSSMDEGGHVVALTELLEMACGSTLSVTKSGLAAAMQSKRQLGSALWLGSA
jgi:hypothetical protein